MHPSRPLLVLILVAVSLLPAPQRGVSAAAQPQKGVTGHINLLSTQPMLICVGDTVSFEGAASVDFPPIGGGDGEPPLAPLSFINLEIEARSGQVSPKTIYHPGDFAYFKFDYKATRAGKDTIALVLNGGAAQIQETVRVDEKCDYDAFLTEVMYFTADLGDEVFRSITTVSGTGTMKRDRQGSEFFQGDGTWHLEETMLSKPKHCVVFYMPPLILHGPFDLDGHLDYDAEQLDVILSFKPNLKESTYHGNSVCVDEDGGRGEGWGIVQGGDESLAAKIETSVPLGGGSNQVEMKGAGMQMVQEAGDLDYIATLTILPR